MLYGPHTAQDFIPGSSCHRKPYSTHVNTLWVIISLLALTLTLISVLEWGHSQYRMAGRMAYNISLLLHMKSKCISWRSPCFPASWRKINLSEYFAHHNQTFTHFQNSIKTRHESAAETTTPLNMTRFLVCQGAKHNNFCSQIRPTTEPTDRMLRCNLNKSYHHLSMYIPQTPDLHLPLHRILT